LLVGDSACGGGAFFPFCSFVFWLGLVEGMDVREGM